MAIQERDDSPRRWCFGCGDSNPQGLRMSFRLDDQRAVGEFMVRDVHQGHPGLAHGGVAAAALDEAMGWAMYAAGIWALTARMEIKYRRPLRLGEMVTVAAQLTRSRGRWLEVRGEMRDAAGNLLAQSKGVFMRLPEEEARALAASYLTGPEAPSGTDQQR